MPVKRACDLFPQERSLASGQRENRVLLPSQGHAGSVEASDVGRVISCGLLLVASGRSGLSVHECHHLTELMYVVLTRLLRLSSCRQAIEGASPDLESIAWTPRMLSV